MLFSVRNVEKFVVDHDNEIPLMQRNLMLYWAKKVSNKNLIREELAMKIFGAVWTEIFFQEISNDPEHALIGLEDTIIADSN